MLGAMRVFRQQQDAAGCGEHEQDAYQRFLLLRPAFFGPVQSCGSQQRSAYCGQLYGPDIVFPAQHARGQNAQSGDLGNRQVDKNNAPFQDFLPQWHVGAQYQQAGDDSRSEYRPVE